MNWLYGLGAVTIIWAFGAGWAFVSTASNKFDELSQLQHAQVLWKGREESYKRMIERRDAAIAASKCKPQIQEWVRHPENIPKPFDPFNQLTPENLR